MDERVREAFAQVRAEEALREHTLAYLAQSTGNWQSVPASRRRPRPLVTAAACAACLLMTLGSLWLYFTPAAYISVDVNPSLELTVNRFDRVISVTGLNDDGVALAESLQVRFLDYTAALEQVLDSPVITDCLARDEALSITVAGADEARTEEMLSQVSACAEERGGAYCHAADLQTAEAARDHGLSCGKYQMLLALQALDPTVTAEDVQNMTMRELRTWLAALESAADEVPSGQQGQTGNSQDSGGQGYLSGNGQGGNHGHEHGHHGE